MEIEIIKGIQQGANVFFDNFFLGVTYLGDTMFFIVAMALLYWCYDKKFAFNFVIGCGVSILANNALKIAFNRPRPYVANSQIVDYTHSTGGSFPSGHASSIAVMSSMLMCEVNAKSKIKWQKLTVNIILPIICVLVAFSRMYLGQHYLTDVLVGLAISGIIGMLWHKFCFVKSDKEHIYALFALPVLIGALFIFVDELLLTTGHKMICMLIGLCVAIIVGYYLEKKYIRLDYSSDKLWFVITKAVVGGGVAVGLYFLLENILPQIVLIKFFIGIILGLWITFGSMLVFRAIASWARLNKKGEDDASIK